MKKIKVAMEKTDLAEAAIPEVREVYLYLALPYSPQFSGVSTALSCVRIFLFSVALFASLFGRFERPQSCTFFFLAQSLRR